MCLHRIIGKPEKTNGIGYKVFAMREEKLTGFSYGWGNGYKIGETYKSEPSTEKDDKGNKYQTGFHIAETVEDCKLYLDWQTENMQSKPDYVIIKISYKEARILGSEEVFNNKTIPCIIADEITLLEIVH